jgi:hypothetical protein
VALAVQTAAREREYKLLENRGEWRKENKRGGNNERKEMLEKGEGGAAEEGGKWRGK